MAPPSDLPDATNAEDALFDLILLVAERVLDLAASAEREARLAELAELSVDLHLFTQTAVRLAAYMPRGALTQPV